MLKDWSWHKKGDVADVFDPTAKNWVAAGIAEVASDARTIPAERAVSGEQAETAMLASKRSQPRKQ